MTAGAPRHPTARATPGTTALLWKDAQALLPIWSAGIAAATIAGLTSGGITAPRRLAFVDLHAVSLAVCVASIIGLGAQALGHEYSHRTLGLTLTLPVSRRRLFLHKQATVGAMVLPLVLYLSWRQAFDEFPALLWLAAAAAFSMAPLSTMICRSSLAGAIFAASVPATVLVVMQITTAFVDPSADAARAARERWAWLMIPMAAASLVLGWRRFMRLEVLDGNAAARPGLADHHASASPRRHFLWLIVWKELRLQRMALVLTLLYAIGTVCAAIVHEWQGDDPASRHVFGVASAIYWLGLPVLAGSLATAEERQLGTLAWQMQLPVHVWRQWLIKAVAALGLGVLGAGVPVLLSHAFWPSMEMNGSVAVVLAIVMASASMYISSLCRSGVRAAVASLTIIPTLLWLVAIARLAFGRTPSEAAPWSGREGTWLTLVFLVVGLLLGFAFLNHRPEPPGTVRCWRQILSLTALLAAGLAAIEMGS